MCVSVALSYVSWYGQKSRLSVEEAPDPTFVAPGRYPEYFLANEDFLCAKSSRTMDYDMESKVSGTAGEQTVFDFMGTTVSSSINRIVALCGCIERSVVLAVLHSSTTVLLQPHLLGVGSSIRLLIIMIVPHYHRFVDAV